MAKKQRMRTSTRKLLLGVVLLGVVVGLGAALVFGVPLACTSAGERRLIGSWELESTQAAAPVKAPPVAPGQPGAGEVPAPTAPGETKVRDFFKNMGKALESWASAVTPELRVSFERDGTFTESIGLGGRRQVVTGRWEVVEPGDRQVVVRILDREGDSSRAMELTITFEGDDVMLYPAGAGQPQRMVRRRAE